MSGDESLDAIRRAAAELIPALTERLERHGLGEIEVSHGEIRLRVAAPASGSGLDNQGAGNADSAAVASAPSPASAQTLDPSGGASAPSGEGVGVGVASPAVGFFVYADGLGPGLSVEKGDALGHIEMLGVRHDVRAPRGGTVRHLIAESGEAVEYGQVVVELEPAEPAR